MILTRLSELSITWRSGRSRNDMVFGVIRAIVGNLRTRGRCKYIARLATRIVVAVYVRLVLRRLAGAPVPLRRRIRAYHLTRRLNHRPICRAGASEGRTTRTID